MRRRAQVSEFLSLDLQWWQVLPSGLRIPQWPLGPHNLKNMTWGLPRGIRQWTDNSQKTWVSIPNPGFLTSLIAPPGGSAPAGVRVLTPSREQKESEWKSWKTPKGDIRSMVND